MVVSIGDGVFDEYEFFFDVDGVYCEVEDGYVFVIYMVGYVYVFEDVVWG